MRKTTILVADDHAIVKEGLVSLLKQHDFDLVGSVGDGISLVEEARRLRPDIIIADISMPGLSGLEALERITAENLPCKMILLTMHRDADLAARAVRSGAAGFLLKDAAGDELVAAIEQVMQGRLYLTPAVTRDVMERMTRTGDDAPPTLTTRQREVLRLILAGHRMKEIAGFLALSPRTVESHKYEIMDLLGVHSTAELVRYAIEHRLVPE
jgi:DNA-binding NarL/FixJ family response regulator